MSEPPQKCENYDIIKQNYTPELLIVCSLNDLFLLFWPKGKSRFSRFPPKKSFITSTPDYTKRPQ